jgi:hypothetical protein
MPSILSDEDKLTVKRTVPKSANKIHTVAVAKLYIAYPNRQQWTYTGLQGAAVLANDLVGNTFWIKLVDISVGTPRLCVEREADTRSRATVASFGTRKYTTRLATTRTALSSIPSSSRTVWLACHSPTRRRPRHSRRRSTTVRRTPTRTHGTSPSARLLGPVGLRQTGRATATACWAASSADTRHSPRPHRSPSSRRPPSPSHRPRRAATRMPQARGIRQSIRQIPHGSLC